MSIMWRIRPSCQTKSITEYAGTVLFSCGCDMTCTALGTSFASDLSRTENEGETGDGATAVSSNIWGRDGDAAFISEFGMLVQRRRVGESKSFEMWEFEIQCFGKKKREEIPRLIRLDGCWLGTVVCKRLKPAPRRYLSYLTSVTWATLSLVRSLIIL